MGIYSLHERPLGGRNVSKHIPKATRGGIEKANRVFVDRLNRLATGPFTAAEAASLLKIPLARASRVLRYLQSRGWLSRVRRGLYTTAPLGASEPAEWRADPWVVASHVFKPCYVAGWTALHHWSLTEQLFRDTVVVTARPVRARKVRIQGAGYYLKRRPTHAHFGLKSVWRASSRVPVSDASRTLVDVLDDPRLGGGIRHVAAALVSYWESEYLDADLLLSYAARARNRAVYKRLGFLLEQMGIHAPSAIEECKVRRSSGLTVLDPSVRLAGTITKRWNLRVNVTLKADRGA